MDKLTKAVEELKSRVEAAGIPFLDAKPVNYGMQLRFGEGTAKASVTVYNGKKGLKLVVGGAASPLKERLTALAEGKGVAPTAATPLAEAPGDLSLLSNIPGFDQLWVGSDESGKGDFFGPLALAAVMVDKQAAEQLIALGVKDCKVLTDKKVLELAPKILELGLNVEVLHLTPAMYNFRYQQLKQQGQNLNDLLAAGHVAVLKHALARRPDCRFVLVDRFALHNNIAAQIQADFPAATVVQQPKAEADIAVAAASILARARFLQVLAELEAAYGVSIPKGGGPAATHCAQLIAEEQGQAVLAKLVKMHFANYKKIQFKGAL